LSESVRILDENGRGIAGVSWNMLVRPGGQTTGQVWPGAGLKQGIFRVSPQTNPAAVVVLLATMHPPSTVLYKDCFEELGGFYSKNACRYSEDAHLWFKLLLRYPHYLHQKDGAIMHTDASALSWNYTAVRPLEPFLTDPGDILQVCPAELEGIVRTVIATRALKTAAVYGYWGHAAQARKLLREFVQPSDWRLPFFAHALIGCTPAGGWIGALDRFINGRRK
jgi:hypothetical protein